MIGYLPLILVLLSSSLITIGAFTTHNISKRQPTCLQANNLSKESIKIVTTRFRRSFLISVGSTLTTLAQKTTAAKATTSEFKRIPTQFIAALGDPASSSGANANEWGLWRVDPGPRGVFLKDYTKQIAKNNGVAPKGWKFNEKDWWLEEHGLIMESPDFPLEAGRYLVTGGRSMTTSLTVTNDGKWSLEKGVLYDVTHLPCRSARYTPNGNGSPLTADQSNFPVSPGAEMPKVDGCNKLDYAVLFVIGKEIL